MSTRVWWMLQGALVACVLVGGLGVISSYLFPAVKPNGLALPTLISWSIAAGTCIANVAASLARNFKEPC